MTTRPTDEEIRAMAAEIRATWPKADPLVRENRCNRAAHMLEAWLAERQAARDGVTTDDLHQLAFEHSDTDDAGTGYNFSMEQFDAFASAVFQSVSQLVRVVEAAVIPDVNKMVDRFLGWRLPEDFSPDCHISFDRESLKQWPGVWPIGTNLLTAAQAEQMIRHILHFSPQPRQAVPEIDKK